MADYPLTHPVDLLPLAEQLAVAFSWPAPPALSVRQPGQVDLDGTPLPGVLRIENREPAETAVAGVLASSRA